MQYLKMFNPYSFNFHDGAKDTFKTILTKGKVDKFEEYLNAVFDGQTPTEGEINDFVWFNADEIDNALGI